MATVEACTHVYQDAASYKFGSAEVAGPVERLAFDVDAETESLMERCSQSVEARMDNYDARFLSFKKYGKAAIKNSKTHPDTFVQLAIQVAAYKTHSK